MSNNETDAMKTATGEDPPDIPNISPSGQQPHRVWLPGKRKRRPRNFVENATESPSGLRQGLYADKSPVADFLSTEAYGPEIGGKAVDMNEVINWIYDDKTRQRIIGYLKQKGYPITSFDDVYKYWSQAVQHASDAFEYSGPNHSQRPTPWDMLDTMAPYDGQANQAWRGQSFNKSTTAIDFADMAPETARGILTKALTDSIGRAPSDAEIEDFSSRAAAIVHENPRVAHTTTQYTWDPQAQGPNQGGYVESGSVTQTNGADSGAISDKVNQSAVDTAQQSPEYGAYQASTTYMNALMQLIMGGG